MTSLFTSRRVESPLEFGRPRVSALRRGSQIAEVLDVRTAAPERRLPPLSFFEPSTSTYTPSGVAETPRTLKVNTSVHGCVRTECDPKEKGHAHHPVEIQEPADWRRSSRDSQTSQHGHGRTNDGNEQSHGATEDGEVHRIGGYVPPAYYSPSENDAYTTQPSISTGSGVDSGSQRTPNLSYHQATWQGHSYSRVPNSDRSATLNHRPSSSPNYGHRQGLIQSGRDAAYVLPSPKMDPAASARTRRAGMPADDVRSTHQESRPKRHRHEDEFDHIVNNAGAVVALSPRKAARTQEAPPAAEQETVFPWATRVDRPAQGEPKFLKDQLTYPGAPEQSHCLPAVGPSHLSTRYYQHQELPDQLPRNSTWARNVLGGGPSRPRLPSISEICPNTTRNEHSSAMVRHEGPRGGYPTRLSSSHTSASEDASVSPGERPGTFVTPNSPEVAAPGRGFPGCPPDDVCQGENPRCAVSHFFGRNKRESHTITELKNYVMCRKHYQRLKFHHEKSRTYYKWQKDTIVKILNLVEKRLPNLKFTIKMGKGLDDAYNVVVRAKHNYQDPAAQDYFNKNGREKYKHHTRIVDKPDLQSRTGPGKSFDEVRAYVELLAHYVRLDIEAGNTSTCDLPIVEFLPPRDP